MRRYSGGNAYFHDEYFFVRAGHILLQAVGFLACFMLFLLPACLWELLTSSAAGAKAFQFIYFFSSFWNQFGPNCTTFLVAGKNLINVTKASTKHVLAVPFAL
jgi:hypothetical protein